MNETNNVIITDLEASVKAIGEKVLNDLAKNDESKVVKWDWKSVNIEPTSPFTKDMSEHLGVISGIYELYEKLQFTIAYHQGKYLELMDVENPTEDDLKQIEYHEIEMRKARAYYAFAKKRKQKSISELYAGVIELVYPSYLDRGLDCMKGFKEAIKNWFKTTYGMTVSNAVTEYIAYNIGVNSASIKSRAYRQIEAKSDVQFAGLFRDLVLELAIQKDAIKNKVVRATINTLTKFSVEEYDAQPMIELPSRPTIAFFKEVIEETGADKPKQGSKAKYADWERAYNKAKRAGFFIEY